MDNHKMTLFSKQKKKKKVSELQRSRWNKSQYHEVPTVLYLSLFFSLDWTEHAFFNLIISKNAKEGKGTK